ncbi:MAG: radical SAM protein [Helicobacteraceae bacterium]|nr:radical SAM protein [Helicobacteraceae bacterium]
MGIVFGPILSRRFGTSLGIDLSPNKKQCNFDCVYCELNRAKSIDKFDDIVPLEILLEESKEALKKHTNIDVFTITANGEPTMYPYLNEFIKNIKPFVPKNVKTLILSNGSLFGNSMVQEALSEFDIVKFSLDSFDLKSFKKIDRFHKSLDLESIKEGIKKFAKIRKNMLICEILLVKNINDNPASMLPLAQFLREIKVDRIDLGTIDRPPAYKVEAVNEKTIYELSKLFGGLFVSIPQRKQSKAMDLLELDENAILSLIQRRPLSLQEILNVFSKDSTAILNKLLDSKKIELKSVGKVDFYTIAKK